MPETTTPESKGIKAKNRILISLATLAIHVPIGAVYAYSLWKDPLLEAHGWEHSQTSLAFSLAIFALGMSAAFLGHLVESKSPRFAAFIGGPMYSLGYIISGIATHDDVKSSILYYIGYLTLGAGCGILYVCPVSTMCKYLPDHRGLATGIAITGFGLGSFIATPVIDALQDSTSLCNAHLWLALIYIIPILLGGSYIAPPPPGWEPGMKYVPVQTDDTSASSSQEEMVDVVSASEVSESEAEEQDHVSEATTNNHEDSESEDEVSEGAEALKIRATNPADDKTLAEDQEEVIAHARQQPITVVTDGKKALRMVRFYVLWFLMFVNISSGLGFISDAKPMSKTLKAHFTSQEASDMVGRMGLFNAFGRFVFSSLSDWIGRPAVYVTIFVIQIVASQFLAYVENKVVFQAIMYINISCYGAGFATLPAFLSDLFSLKSLATTHGYALTAWGIAGLVGPNIFQFWVDKYDYKRAIFITSVYFMVALAVSIAFCVWFYRARSQNVKNAVADWKKCVLEKPEVSQKSKKDETEEVEA